MSAQNHRVRPEGFSILSPTIACVLAVLNHGRDGNLPAAVHASSKGFRITVGRKTIARGKTPRELAANFDAAVAGATLQPVTPVGGHNF